MFVHLLLAPAFLSSVAVGGFPNRNNDNKPLIAERLDEDFLYPLTSPPHVSVYLESNGKVVARAAGIYPLEKLDHDSFAANFGAAVQGLIGKKRKRQSRSPVEEWVYNGCYT